MKEEVVKFISEVIKPWEILNQKFSTPLSMNPAINDFITSANALTISIKHLPEALMQAKPHDLAQENKSYEILHDLADSIKHGANNLRNQSRRSTIDVSTMFERNSDAIIKNGEFSNEIYVHASIENQVHWQAMKLEFVEFESDGSYKNVDLNGQVLFQLTINDQLCIG